MKALVTGGAGLIGSHIVDRLLERGDEVRILDNLEPQTHRQGTPPWVPEDAEFVHGDIRDRDTLAHCLRGVDDVYHQAAFGGFTSEISLYHDVNATSTALIFEVIAEHGLEVRKIVAASSQAIYGEGLYRCGRHGVVQPAMREVGRLTRREWEPICPECRQDVTPTLTSEEARWNGETPYAVSKLSEERTVLGMGRRMGIPVVALRYAVTYGPRQSVFNPYTGVVSIFSTLLLNGLAPTVYEDGRQTRDYIFVGDVARANLLVMESGKPDGKAMNVGTGQAVDVVQLIERLALSYGLEPTYSLTGDFRPGDVRHLVHDATEIRQLGWRPETSLEDGLAQFVEWIKDLGKPEDYFTSALEGMRERRVVVASRKR